MQREDLVDLAQFLVGQTLFVDAVKFPPMCRLCTRRDEANPFVAEANHTLRSIRQQLQMAAHPPAE
jgi:hypothetical protein